MNAASPKPRPSKKSSAASNALSSESSTALSELASPLSQPAPDTDRNVPGTFSSARHSASRKTANCTDRRSTRDRPSLQTTSTLLLRSKVNIAVADHKVLEPCMK